MVALPAETPVTTPEAVPTPATAALLLLQTPPDVLWLKVVAEPTHTAAVPANAEGALLTVSVTDAAQPVASVYEISAFPVPAAVTTPTVETAAMELLVLLHAPPGVVLLKAATDPTHIVAGPEMAAGSGLTVTTASALQPALNA